MGLRGQIILALGLVFALSFALLGMTAVELSRRAERNARATLQQTLANAIATHDVHELSEADSRVPIWLTQLGVIAADASVSVRVAGREIWKRGTLPSRGVSRALGEQGVQVSVWLPPRDEASTPPVARLLLFYVLLTGAAVLLMTYVALTHLIVRPLGGLTASAERLATSAPHIRVVERGAAEVRGLARAFNEMASQLRLERSSLEQRLYELEEATAELKFTQRQLVHGEKLASVGRLAAGVAHEIGNPLSAVLGFVELLQGEGIGEDERAEFLTRIHKETTRIHHIIRDLLDFARQGGEQERLDVTSDLRAAIDDAVNLVRPQKELRGIEIVVDVPSVLSRVTGAQHRLTQVMLNLLLNAADAMKGNGRIRIEARALSDSEFVELLVTDTGPGFSPEIKDRLFEPFATTKPVGAGTGLGLAVSHTLIEGMGGTIAADNPVEGGARLTIRLRKPRASIRPPAM